MRATFAGVVSGTPVLMGQGSSPPRRVQVPFHPEEGKEYPTIPV